MFNKSHKLQIIKNYVERHRQKTTTTTKIIHSEYLYKFIHLFENILFMTCEVNFIFLIKKKQ